MANATPTLKFSGSKQSEIAAVLRRKIVQGEQAPGSRLPTWDEMERQFSVSRPTLRLALGDLRAQGFIEADSTRGTFVARRPPCKHRYGVAFHEQPGTARWNRFYGALAEQAAAISRSGDRQLEVICNVTVNETSESRRKILEEVENHCFAGLIQVGGVSLMQDARWRAMSVPRVAICRPRNMASDCGLPAVGMDWTSFWNKSLDWLASRGRKRLAVLAIDFHPQAGLCELAHQRGFTVKPAWHHVGSAQYTQGAGNIVQLLMDPSLAEKPDALIVTDDNLVEAALGGLLASDVQVGKGLDVVAHCCWPWPVPTMPQVRRLGFDAAEVLSTALDVLEAQRSGNAVPPEQFVPARFEDELSSSAMVVDAATVQ